MPLLYNLTMMLARVLVILGIPILLAGLVGFRLVHRLKIRWSVLLSLLGLGLIGLSLWIDISHRPGPIPRAAPTATSTDAAALTRAGQPPVVLDIQTRKASTSIGLVISALILFKDPDGDAETVAFALDQTTGAEATLEPERIVASPQEQEQGTSLSVEWDCQGSADMFLFKAVILDRAGHRSNIVPLLFDCG